MYSLFLESSCKIQLKVILFTINIIGIQITNKTVKLEALDKLFNGTKENF